MIYNKKAFSATLCKLIEISSKRFERGERVYYNMGALILKELKPQIADYLSQGISIRMTIELLRSENLLPDFISNRSVYSIIRKLNVKNG